MSEYFRKYLKKNCYPVHPSNIKFKTNFKNTLYEACKFRGWKETESLLLSRDDWDLIWADKEWIHEVMDHIHLKPNQRVNHFRNHFELTRKDLMIRNLKRYKKQLEKDEKIEEAECYNFFPTTYDLPKEYSIFVEEFKKNAGIVWIMKPIARSQGKGIFLFNKLSQISQWKNDYKWKPENPQAEPYIVQRYIIDPLLIGGKKFDLRIYALVTSYQPLTIYLYRTGFARFTSFRYNTNVDEISNTYMHLTNVAVQKTSENYNEKTGGKWELRSLKQYLISKYGLQIVATCFEKIQEIILKTLRSVSKVIIHDKHCFELYGYDILIDKDLRPWLIEINASPSLTANTPEDFKLKCRLVDDVFSIVDLEKLITGNETQVGGFDLICKGEEIKLQEHCQFKTNLGCLNNRDQQLKKLAKTISSKLNHSSKKLKNDETVSTITSQSTNVLAKSS